MRISLLIPAIVVATLFVMPAHAGLMLDVNGTPNNATITASVTNDDSFTFDLQTGTLLLFLQPNIFETEVHIEGPNGDVNPWIIRGPSDGSYLNVVRISTGDFSPYTLDKNNPITSSSNVTLGDITSLAAFDGVSSFMQVISGGTGPDTFVNLNYNIVPEVVPEPSSALLLGIGALACLVRRRQRTQVA